MAKKARKKSGHRNVAAVAMRKRYPRRQVMAHCGDKRAGDAKNHWSREWD